MSKTARNQANRCMVLDELATKVLAGEIPAGALVEADFDPDHPDKIAFNVKS